MRRVIWWVVLTLMNASLFAQTSPAGPPPCRAEAYRQFDFWVGEWQVRVGDKLAGRNTITRSADGCMLREHWRSVGGFEGRSLNGYDRAYGVWRQFWIGGDGGVLQLSGGVEGGSMRMSGVVRQADGHDQAQRIRWTPHADGRITQRWETSDDGEQWNVVFLGEYEPMPTETKVTPPTSDAQGAAK